VAQHLIELGIVDYLYANQLARDAKPEDLTSTLAARSAARI
jgi:hypothetical protein